MALVGHAGQPVRAPGTASATARAARAPPVTPLYGTRPQKVRCSTVKATERLQPDATTGAFSADANRAGWGGSPFPAIADYAFLSDCETTCLIAPSGAVEWMCVPRPDSPSIFSALLDRSAGSFRLGPYDEMVPAARRYLPGSLMVETTWQTRTGWLIVRDALCMGPWHNLTERSKTHRRSPDRLRRRALPAADGQMRERCGRPVHDLRPDVRLRPHRARLGTTRATGTARSWSRRRRHHRQAAASPPTCVPGSSAGASTPAPAWSRATATSWPCRGRRCRPR